MDVVKSLSSCYISCRLALWADWEIHFIGKCKQQKNVNTHTAVNIMRRMWTEFTWWCNFFYLEKLLHFIIIWQLKMQKTFFSTSISYFRNYLFHKFCHVRLLVFFTSFLGRSILNTTLDLIFNRIYFYSPSSSFLVNIHMSWFIS